MQADRSTELRQLLAERILILDGAMGTMIQQEKLGEADYRGDREQPRQAALLRRRARADLAHAVDLARRE